MPMVHAAAMPVVCPPTHLLRPSTFNVSRCVSGVGGTESHACEEHNRAVPTHEDNYTPQSVA